MALPLPETERTSFLDQIAVRAGRQEGYTKSSFAQAFAQLYVATLNLPLRPMQLALDLHRHPGQVGALAQPCMAPGKSKISQ